MGVKAVQNEPSLGAVSPAFLTKRAGAAFAKLPGARAAPYRCAARCSQSSGGAQKKPPMLRKLKKASSKL